MTIMKCVMIRPSVSVFDYSLLRIILELKHASQIIIIHTHQVLTGKAHIYLYAHNALS